MPSGVNATTDGRSGRPSASGMTRGSPVVSSTYATRLFVVPRSIPMMDGIRLLAERFGQILDHRTQVGAGGERGLERGEHLRAIGGRRAVPATAQRPREPPVFVLQACAQGRPLVDERGARGLVERAGARLRERLLDLEHLLQQLR